MPDAPFFANNDLFWKEYAVTFEKHKALDPQPIWFFEKHLFADLLRIPRTKRRILEIGCGSGRGMQAIHKTTGVFPIGTDISKEVLQQAKAKDIPSENLFLAHLLYDPLPAGEWEVIWVSDLFIYFNPEKEIDLAMNKLCSSLKTGGSLGLRWSAGNDEMIVRKQNSTFLASENFLRNLLIRHNMELAFIEKRGELVYVADNLKRNGKSIYSDFWYLLAKKKQLFDPESDSG